MEMKVENNEFWILDNKKTDDKTLFNDIDESIKYIKKMKKKFNPEDIELMHIILEDDSMKYQGVSWKEIAMKLLNLE